MFDSPETFFSWFMDYSVYFWIVMTILFLFAELNTPGLFFFISFAVGSLCAAVLALFGYSLVIQCLGGLLVSIISFFLLKKYLKKTQMSEVFYDDHHTNIYALAGKSGVVMKSIEADRTGSVKVGGEVWRARSEKGETIEKGKMVSVLKIEGNTVVVKEK